MTGRYFIVINPVAEQGQAILHLPMLTALFDAAGIEYEVHITTGRFDGYEKVKNFCARNPNCAGIIGVGGDGIIQEIVAGMVDVFPDSHYGQKIPIPLGILPSATGNEFVLTLEGGKKQAHEKYRRAPEIVVQNFFDMLIKKQTRCIDVITAGDMAFINMCHVGVSALIPQNAVDIKQKYGEYAYWVSGFKSILKYDNIPLTVDVDGVKQEDEYTFIAICNGKYDGGGMYLSPHSLLDDGKITLVVSKAMSRIKAAITFIYVLSGNKRREKRISYENCEVLKLTLPSTILCLDSNLYPMEGEIEFKILPGVLEVFV